MSFKYRFLFLILVITVFPSAARAASEMDRQIGIIYLKNAASRYLIGDFEESINLLGKAEEFYSGSSDSSYIRGLVTLSEENDINEAVKRFSEAVEFNNWMLLEKRDCVTDLSRLLFRIKRYDDVVSLVEQEYYPDFSDSDLMYVYLLSLKRTGRLDSYRTGLRKSIRRYPADYRFAELFSEESSSFRERLLKDMPGFSNREGGNEVFLKAAWSLPDGTEKIRALKKYIDDGGKSNRAFIELYRLEGGIDKNSIDRLIDSGLFENTVNRKTAEAILPTAELRRYFRNAWESYTGSVFYDLNEDGYFEEMHLYDAGIPAGISIDSNQDGVLEIILVFENGIPAELICTGERSYRMQYGLYPYIEEISVSGTAGLKVYTFMKEDLTLDIFGIRKTDEKLVVDTGAVNAFTEDFEGTAETAIKTLSYSMRGDSGPSGMRSELERYDENGAVLRTYDRLYGNYIYHIRNMDRTEGFGDIDFDNLIDFRENYRDGRLVSIEADENKNGIYDYKLSFDEGKSVSWWDFNEDGTYDCRQYERNGILIKEYSSEMNGIFDITEQD